MSRVYRDDLFKGKVVVVTGGGTGIGVAVARELGSLGASVVIASRKETNILPAAAGLSEELGREVVGEICNIRDREAVTAFVARVLERFGRIDILVNNGGGQFFSPAEAISGKGFDAVVGTNLTGTWNMTRAVADAWMLQTHEEDGKRVPNGGKVINITMLTKTSFPGMAHSHASRAGVEAMTRTLAVEWAPRGILLNCVAPGFVASSGLRRYPAGLQIIEQMQSYVPLKRLATCEEVAWAVTYLVGPTGNYLTGQVLTIDGGKENWGDWWPIPDPPDMPPIEIPVEPWETTE